MENAQTITIKITLNRARDRVRSVAVETRPQTSAEVPVGELGRLFSVMAAGVLSWGIAHWMADDLFQHRELTFEPRNVRSMTLVTTPGKGVSRVGVGDPSEGGPYFVPVDGNAVRWAANRILDTVFLAFLGLDEVQAG